MGSNLTYLLTQRMLYLQVSIPEKILNAVFNNKGVIQLENH